MTGAYLAYPIDQAASSAHMMQQAEKFKNMMLAMGVAKWVFDPGDAMSMIGYSPDPAVRQINGFAARRADILVAFLPSNIPSIGVPMEIQAAIMEGKHVFVFSDAPSYMLDWDARVMKRWPGWEDVHLNEAIEQMENLSEVEDSRVTPLPVKMLSDLGFLPTRSHENDAGLDLIVSQDTRIYAGKFVDVPCAIAVELPPWSWGLIMGRSSTFRKRDLLVYPGIVDTGYRGPIFAGVWNAGGLPINVQRGERIAQMIILPNQTQHIQPVQVENLSESTRGQSGFGSSGT